LDFAAEEERTKAAKEEAHQKKRADREEALEVRKQHLATLVCRSDDCKHIHRGGRLWNVCPRCAARFCPKHKRAAQEHEIECDEHVSVEE